MISGSDAPAQYVRLAFMIDRLFPGYIDAYCGPPELRSEALSGEKPSLEVLRESASSLRQSIVEDNTLTPDRRAFLKEELRAMCTTIEILAGNGLSIVDEVELLYGLKAEWVDESVFEGAHSTLEEVLPGPEPLRERVQAFRDRSRVPVEVAASVISWVADTIRTRTRSVFGLPTHEDCEISFVADRPWRAYNWYLGKGKSRIEFNRDAPFEMWDIPIAVAHEMYLGHHTERTVKEYRLYVEEKRLEHCIALNNTPSALISEGIATNALEVIASRDEIEAMLVECYERAGLQKSDGERAVAFAEAYRQLERVVDNQALLLYGRHASDDEVVGYGVRYALTTHEDERLALRFLKDPLSRSYTYNYTLGGDLVAAFLDRAEDRRQAFWRLLSEPLTPTRLRSELSACAGRYLEADILSRIGRGG